LKNILTRVDGASYSNRPSKVKSVISSDVVSTEDNILITKQPRDIMKTEQPKQEVQDVQVNNRKPQDIIESIIAMLYSKIDKQVHEQLVLLEKSLQPPQNEQKSESNKT
jgi:hypothetical protein